MAIVSSRWVALVLGLLSGPAEASRFRPDPAFGDNGVVNLLPGNGTGGVIREVGGVRPGPDGSFYVSYRELPGAEMDACEAPRYFARYLPNGALDASFGDGGFITVASPLGCEHPGGLTLVDGHLRPLLIWGSVGTPDVPSSILAVTRLTSDGALDPSFGTSGTAFLQIPCPGGNGANVRTDSNGRLILAFGCRDDESAGGLPTSSFESYLARLQPNGELDTGFGSGGFLGLPLEAGWEPPDISAVELDGSVILSQSSKEAEGVPRQTRLWRVRPDGTPDSGYRARVEHSLRRVASLGALRIPEEATDVVLRPNGGIAVSGRASRGGWVIALRHDGSLDHEFSDDGYRRFATLIRFIAADRRDQLIVLGLEPRGLTIFRLRPDGNRDQSVGGPNGQRLRAPYFRSLSDLVSLRRDRLLLYFQNLGSCSSPQACTEPAELRRFRLFPKASN